MENAENRAAPNDVVGQFLQPAEEQCILSRAPNLGHGQFHEVRGAVIVQGGKCVYNRFRGHAPALIPAAGSLMQQRNLPRPFAEQAGPKHIGKEAVIAVPFAPVVQRNDKQVGTLQRLEHVAPVLAAGHGVTKRTGQPVKNG